MDRLGLTTNGRLRIGLTGGIGSGKSTVAQMLVDCGAHLVDTDAIARSLTAPGGVAMPQIALQFGREWVSADGSLNRDLMRQRVFVDPLAKAALEAILHPLIGAEALRQAALQPERPLVYDVPLLAESQGSRPWRSRVDRVLVVDCSAATQVQRVARRPGWTAEAAERVIALQARRDLRRSMADAVIHNEQLSLNTLRQAVERLWRTWVPVEQSSDRLTPFLAPP